MESARLAAPCLQICKMVFSRHRHCHQPGASCEALPWKVMRPRVAPRTPRPGRSCVGCVLPSTRQDQGDAICLPAALALVFATGKRTDPVQAEPRLSDPVEAWRLLVAKEFGSSHMPSTSCGVSLLMPVSAMVCLHPPYCLPPG